MATQSETPDTEPSGKAATRKRLFLIFGAVLAVIAAVVLIWQLGFAWRSVSIAELQGYTGIDVFPALSAQVKAGMLELPAPRPRAPRTSSASGAGSGESTAWNLAKRVMKVW